MGGARDITGAAVRLRGGRPVTSHAGAVTSELRRRPRRAGKGVKEVAGGGRMREGVGGGR